MTHILTYNQIDRQQWSELVQTSETGTWFQSPEAYDFYASLPELMEPFVYGIERVRELGSERISELVGICVGYVTKERNAIKQYFTRRAIIIGGPAIADDCAKEDVVLLLNRIRKDLRAKTIYIETRNFNDYIPWKEAFEAAEFAYKPHLNFHVDCTDKAQMDSRLSDTRAKQIRRARRAGVEIEELRNEGEIRDWYAMLREMYRKKVKTPLWPVDFFIRANECGAARFLMVKYAKRVIGGLMLVEDEKCVYEWYECGRDTEYERLYPSVLATYAGMEYAASHRITRCDFMGAGEPGIPYGVRDFKARFGGELVEHGRFLCVCKPMLYKIGKLVVKFLERK